MQIICLIIIIETNPLRSSSRCRLGPRLFRTDVGCVRQEDGSAWANVGNVQQELFRALGTRFVMQDLHLYEYDTFALDTDGPPLSPELCATTSAIKCESVWVWKIAEFVMLVWHGQKVCDACPRRDPFACHAKTQFVMLKTQHKEAQIFLMLGCALQSIHYSQRSIASFQTQTFLHLISAELG